MYIFSSVARMVRKHGFSLIETAIVLGVVGLVVGGIWVAASAVQEAKRWADWESGWMYYADLSMKNFSSRMSSGGDVAAEPFWENYPPPAGWTGRRSDINNPATYHPIDPFGNVLYGMITKYGPDPVLGIGYAWQYNVPRSQCARMTMFFFSKLNKIYPIRSRSPANGSPTATSTYDYIYNNVCITPDIVYLTLYLDANP